jgi:cell division protein FtsB
MPSARSATYAARGDRAAAPRSARTARAASGRATTAGRGAAATAPGGAAGGAWRLRSVPLHLPISRIKWDRTFRTVMLVVLVLVAYLGIKGMLTLLSTRAQAEQQQGIVHTLARQNKRLEQEQQSLGQTSTIIRDARALGMVRAGERSYSVTGLPGN